MKMLVKNWMRLAFLNTLILLAKITRRWRKTSIPVFVYHSIDETASSLSLHPDQFQKQIDYLHQHKIRLCSIEEAIFRSGAQTEKQNSVLITFDDAYESIAPYLQQISEKGGTAAIFVATDVVGKTNLWDLAKTDIPQLDIMPIDQLCKLSKSGFDIGAHTCSHPNLPQSSSEQTRRELAGSKSKLEKHLQKSITSLAYPFGAHNKAVRQSASEMGFQIAFTTQLGYIANKQDLLQIPRFPGNIDGLTFRLIVHGGYTWYNKFQTIFYGEAQS